VAFSPDGTRVVTGSWDKTARLWDASTGTSVGAAMKHDGPVWSVAFSPDGTRVVTGSWDKTARLWDVSLPPQRVDSPARFELLFEVMTGCRVTSEGTQQMVPIPAEEFLELRRKLGEDDPLLVFQRERIARNALGHTLFLSQNAEDRENWFAAAFQLTRLSQIQPDKGNVRHRLGRACAQQRKWTEAVAAFQSAVRLEPNNVDWTYDLALACLATPDPDPFRTAVESLLALAENSENASDWDTAARLLALHRPDSIAKDRVVNLARRAVEKKPGNWSYRETLGAILFRAGNHADAVVELEKALDLHAKANPSKQPAADDTANNPLSPKVPGGTVWTNSFLAIAHQALGHTDEATRHRTAADRLANSSPSSEWQERLRRELLQQQLKDAFGASEEK
jgi:tetratricopeptide (TPR) repeat protein